MRFRLILLFFILLLAFLLGSWILLSGDFYFLYDQARDLMLVKTLGADHKLMLIGSRSGIGGFFHGPLYIYLLLPFFLLGNGNPLTFTIFYVAIGLITILAGYFVGKKLYDDRVGLLTAFFLAISPRIWGYFNSTQGINLIPLVYIALFYNLIYYFRGKRDNFVWVALFTGLTFQFETATSVILVPIITLMYFLMPKAYKDWKIMLKSVGVFIITMFSFIFFDLRHGFLMTKSLINYVFVQNGKNNTGPFSIRVTDHFFSLIETCQAVLVQNLLLLQVLLIFIILATLYLVFRSKINQHLKKELLLFGLFPVITYVFLLLYSQSIYPEYVLGLTVPIVFFVSIGISLLWKTYLGKILVAIFITANIVQALFILHSQYALPYTNDSAGSFKNQDDVVNWIFNDAKGKEFGYFVYTPEIFTSGMDYLFWWKGNVTHNTPVNKKRSITYLVMYPHLKGDDNAYVFWKKNVVRTNGIVLDEKEMNGITIQKLQIPTDDPNPDPNYYQDLIFR